ncbi:MAG TPA: hypothetical protein VFJ87_13165 [Rhodanobacteraceae bacterium]|nr:hypothetical protein [Rhodanobacteraceae bacterium]
MTTIFHNLPSGTITDPKSYQGQLYLELAKKGTEVNKRAPNRAIWSA